MNTSPAEPHLPFFVYGTLLPGQPNFYLWEAHIVSRQPAVFTNGRLYDVGSYPMLIETEGEAVTGMVISVHAEAYTDVLIQLDLLEGYLPERPDDSDYIRALRDVKLINHTDRSLSKTTLTAWVYIGQAGFVQNLPIVKNGDWVSHIQQKQKPISDWWQNIHTVAGRHNR